MGTPSMLYRSSAGGVAVSVAKVVLLSDTRDPKVFEYYFKHSEIVGSRIAQDSFVF